jgi:hypothetical protein
MSTTLNGYGPHLITTNDDFPLAAVRVDSARPVLLTITLIFGTFDGTVTIKSRGRDSAGTFSTQAYVKPDGSVASAAITADTTVQIDVSGKEIELTTASRTTGTLTVRLGLTTD